MNISHQIEIPIQCPKCGNVLTKRLSELQGKTSATCICGAIISIDADGLKSAGQELANLDEALNKLGK